MLHNLNRLLEITLNFFAAVVKTTLQALVVFTLCSIFVFIGALTILVNILEK